MSGHILVQMPIMDCSMHLHRLAIRQCRIELAAETDRERFRYLADMHRLWVRSARGLAETN